MNKWKLKYIWFKKDVLRWWYWLRHGIKLTKTIDDNGSLVPVLESGEFVSVYRHGSIIDLVAHKRLNNIPQGTIRMIPVQYNHGFAVEFINEKGQLVCRTHLDYDRLYKIATGNRESV